ncbi:copper homeostasis protein CutC [Solilutibacter silvestris]|uniref:PF03932 family protein CutC n=1 Tax=Solilutibacter silvestris TaxID=1645665 RepID=A0A2K1PZ15_9GAMM|nr:copper homeostasis protein CutC [Lysobacter silvestris]PNS08035.1 putative copper resistance-related protein [Lysobacter silvestris]
MTKLLEIAAEGVRSAIAAETGGGDRIELCAGLGEGGTTPSHGVIAAARDAVRIPIFVLIRPRNGDFLYDAREIDAMCRDIRDCAELGCEGVVIGALDADGNVDIDACKAMIAAAAGMEITFHRAFDAVADRAQALERIIDLGCSRVLTSGGARSAPAGAEAIAASVKQAADRIIILSGAGINADNVVELAKISGGREFHASARGTTRSAMRYRNPALEGLSVDWQDTNVEIVRTLRVALDSI